MSKQAFKRVRRHLKMQVSRQPLDSFAWPGGYPIFYILEDGACICPKCANENIDEIDADTRQGWNGCWTIAAADVNYEDDNLWCSHCDCQIESAYGGCTAK